MSSHLSIGSQSDSCILGRQPSDFLSASIHSLPSELLVHIFSFTRFNDLKSISLVCRNWYHHTEHHPLWKQLADQLFEVSSLEVEKKGCRQSLSALSSSLEENSFKQTALTKNFFDDPQMDKPGMNRKIDQCYLVGKQLILLTEGRLEKWDLEAKKRIFVSEELFSSSACIDQDLVCVAHQKDQIIYLFDTQSLEKKGSLLPKHGCDFLVKENNLLISAARMPHKGVEIWDLSRIGSPPLYIKFQHIGTIESISALSVQDNQLIAVTISCFKQFRKTWEIAHLHSYDLKTKNVQFFNKYVTENGASIDKIHLFLRRQLLICGLSSVGGTTQLAVCREDAAALLIPLENGEVPLRFFLQNQLLIVGAEKKETTDSINTTYIYCLEPFKFLKKLRNITPLCLEKNKLIVRDEKLEIIELDLAASKLEIGQAGSQCQD